MKKQKLLYLLQCSLCLSCIDLIIKPVPREGATFHHLQNQKPFHSEWTTGNCYHSFSIIKVSTIFEKCRDILNLEKFDFEILLNKHFEPMCSYKRNKIHLCRKGPKLLDKLYISYLSPSGMIVRLLYRWPIPSKYLS